MQRYPVFPSAKATVRADRYMAAAEALEGVTLVFFDGSTILLPESEADAIEYKSGQEWEFATKARAAGVTDRLVRLGNAVGDVTGQSVADMIQAALNTPDETYAEWSALYLASMETH